MIEKPLLKLWPKELVDYCSVPDAFSISNRHRVDGRPWVIMCMVASADGSLEVDGEADGLGNATDREVFLFLRRVSDVVLVGAATVRASKRYSALTAPQNLFITSYSGDLGKHSEALLMSPTTRVVSGNVNEILRNMPGETCLLEGGAMLNGQMLAAGLVDEVCLTIAPRFVSGLGKRIASGLLAPSELWCLSSLLIDSQGFLFTRYMHVRDLRD